LPEPPFSLPRTMTCAEDGLPTSACINMTDATLGLLTLLRVAMRAVKIQHRACEVNH
jgi:hypothetical protein